MKRFTCHFPFDSVDLPAISKGSKAPPMNVVARLAVYVFCLLALGLLAMTPPAWAEDIITSYQLAAESDPTLRAAEAARNASLEVAPQSLANLLPQLGFDGRVSRDRFHPRNDGDGRTTYYTNKNYRVQLRQAVYQRADFIQLKQADSIIAQANAEYEAAVQELILRVATRYFAVLGAQDNVDFVKADKSAVGRTLEQARQRFDVGLSSITDVADAQARYDLVISDEISAENLLADTYEALRELTGQPQKHLARLKTEIPLKAPEPAFQDEWVTTALDQNLNVLAAEAATESARQEIQIQRSGHYPTVDVTADWEYKDNQFGGVVPLERNDSSIGVQFNLPIYQGGRVVSRTRESRYRFQEAQELLEQQRRATEREARNNYRGVLTNISKVKALQQAVISNETLQDAAEAGFEVGTRTIVDVLDAQRELLRARRDYARSRYDYLLDSLRLKQSAGILSEEDLVMINALLQEDSVTTDPLQTRPFKP